MRIDDFALYGGFLETIPDVAIVVDAAARIVFANALTQGLLGHPPGSLRGQPLACLVPPTAQTGHAADVERYLQAPRVRAMGSLHDLAALHADGSEVPVDIMLRPLEVGGQPMVLALLRDASERRRVERELREAIERERRLALTDPLTGASNRRFYLELVQREIERLRRYGHAFSLCCIDLDHFKAVNDRFGHSVGDELLRELVRVMQQHVRAADLVARLGGDEFAVLLPETDASGTRQVMQQLRAATDVAMRSRGWPVTLSIGALTCYSAPESIDALDRAADALLYEAKARGRNTLVGGQLGRP